jgi:hypothetical protein
MDAAGTTRRAWLAGVPHAGRLSAAPVTLRVTSAANEMDKITKGEVVLSAASLQVAARQLQTILDKPPPRLK